MLFNLRIKQSSDTAFTPVEGFDLADAACTFLGENLKLALFVTPQNAGRDDGDTTYLALVEVEGSATVCARCFYGGISRVGGVKVRNPRERTSISAIELEFGWQPGSLTECDWDGEESAFEALTRKIAVH